MTATDLQSQFAKLPPVDQVVLDPAAVLMVAAHGRVAVTDAVRRAIEQLRRALRQGVAVDVGMQAVLAIAEHALAQQARSSLRPVFNLTGTVLHTNLGRAALPKEALDDVMAVAAGASNLEYDLEAGRRGERDDHIEAEILRITGAEAATVVNNNAAAVMLVLNTLGRQPDGESRGVAVSRGELVEIGGSFRIPDIMAGSGCRLIEVGTTNRTHLKDFEAALGDGDAEMIMKVHTSNYVIEGFTSVVDEAALGALAKRYDVPFVNDLGSGTLINLEDYGLPHEPTPMEALKAGADVVTFSGDKLLGGPQAGIIVGRRDLIRQIVKNPMKRALRCDKMTMAALSAVLRLYADPDRLAERLPTLRWLTRTAGEIGELAQPVAKALSSKLGDAALVNTIECQSQIGSGALPTRTVPSVGVAISKANGDGKSGSGARLNELAAAFRKLPKPVIGRVHDNQFVLDLRCLDDAEGFIAQLDHLDLSS